MEHDARTKLITYDIERKLKRNNRRAVVNTERRLRYAPSVVWDDILSQKIDTTRSDMGLGEANARIVGTDVIVRLTSRPSADVSKYFKALITKSDWSFAELEMEDSSVLSGKLKLISLSSYRQSRAQRMQQPLWNKVKALLELKRCFPSLMLSAQY